MKIALATARKNTLGSKDTERDTELLIEQFKSVGVSAELAVWDDKTVNWADYNLVYLHTPWDFMDKYSAFVQWIERASAITKLINPLEIVKWNINKQYLFELSRKGIAIPGTTLIKVDEPLDSSEERRDIVVKPTVGAGGQDIYRFSSLKEALADKRVKDLHARTEILVQDFDERILSQGEYGAIVIDGQLTHCILKNPGNNEFRIHDIYGGTLEPVDISEQMEVFCRKVYDCLTTKPAYGRIDFIGAAEPVLMELELVEPELFLRFSKTALTKFVETIITLTR